MTKLLNNNLVAFIALIAISTGITVATPTNAQAQDIVDGDLIAAYGDIDIYIVKKIEDKNFKRLILNPDIFDSYGHFDWEDVKYVEEEILDEYTTSALVREVYPDLTLVDGRVFQLFPSEEDSGYKRHLDITAEDFNKHFDKDSIYDINHLEASDTFYITGDPLTIEEVEEMQGDAGVGGKTGSTTVIDSGTSQPQTPTPTPTPTPVPTPTPNPPGGDGPRAVDPVPPVPQPPIVHPVYVSPADVYNFKAIERTTKSITFTWIRVRGATGYGIEYRKSGAQYSRDEWTKADDIDNVDSNERIVATTMDGLEAYTRYIFRVTPKGISRSLVLSRGERTAREDLDAVQGLEAYNEEENSIRLRWERYSKATSYEIAYRQYNTSDEWKTKTTRSIISLIRDLESGKKYSFKIRGIKDERVKVTGPYTGEIIASTVGTLPNLEYVNDSIETNSVTLTWSSTGDTSYEVHYKDKESSTWSLYESTHDLEIEVSGLESGTEYEFKVTGNGSDWSNVVTFQTVASNTDNTGNADNADSEEGIDRAGTPVLNDIREADITSNSVRLSWNRVPETLKYLIQYKMEEQEGEVEGLEDWHDYGYSLMHSEVVEGLNSNQRYKFRIKAIPDTIGVENSLPSNEVEATTRPPEDIERLEAPDISIVPKSLNFVGVEWNRIEGAANYEIRYRENVEKITWLGRNSIPSTSTSISLNSKKTYIISVRAISDTIGTGNSIWSKKIVSLQDLPAVEDIEEPLPGKKVITK